MEEVVGVVAVADERVAATHRLSAEDDGPPVGQLSIDHVYPLLVGVVLALGIADTAVVVEVGLQGFGDADVIGRRTAGAADVIVHLHRPAAVLHQCGNSRFRRCAAGVRAVGGGHGIPVEGRGRQTIEGMQFVARRIAGDGLSGCCRPLVIIHHLCHRCRHTSRHARHVFFRRTVAVVGHALVPMGVDERGDGRACGGCGSMRRA